MRPLRLDLKGFTVFREPTTVDLTDADYFALVGPTGSGKSTVLDAICFALYGTVPRWGDRRRIEHALAPSAAEARVRLVFSSAGVRYVATRVVRRDPKGRVTTSHAGLERLPADLDLATFDLAPAEREALGEVLAGTPAEMEAAVTAAVGLPYEQFTSCVLLPQGEFARFLHAKPAQRQEILVNLLGLHVYQRVGERAGVRHKQAEARAEAARGLLGGLAGVDDATLAAARAALGTARATADEVGALLPGLAEALAAGQAAEGELRQAQHDIEQLDGLRVPAGVATLAADATAARAAEERTAAAALKAEEAEEKAQAELAAAGDRATLTLLVDAHRRRDELVPRVAELANAVAGVQAGHERATTALAAARGKAERAAAAVARAQAGVETAQAADRAASLRVHLVAGAPCPVCEQTVTDVPATPAPALAAARAALARAEKAERAASEAAAGLDRDLRAAEARLVAATTQHEEAAARLAELVAELATAPPLSAVHAGLADIAAAERAVAVAVAAARTARTEARAAAQAAKAAAETVRRAWRQFDQARDALARFGPPAADRDDLVAAWRQLAAWAATTAGARAAERDRTLVAAERAIGAITAATGQLDALLTRAGYDPDAPLAADPAGYQQAAALLVERAAAALDRVVERRAQAADLAAQVAEHERAAQVAKSLALHLRADRFERWLLTEALDAIVAGASGILLELSGGQYELVHDKGEFSIVDHADADLRRSVRTLSGGETFQASLALALALAEQVAGLSSASAGLESILLDEGFGTLDATTLDTVAATLENLAARGERMVGVVTHVPALAERIPVRFEVRKDARGVAGIVRSG
jgi:exonuclease SbcC